MASRPLADGLLENGGVQHRRADTRRRIDTLNGGEVYLLIPEARVTESSKVGMRMTMEIGFKFRIKPSGVSCEVMPAAALKLPSIWK